MLEPSRRLSPLRLSLVLVVVCVIGFGFYWRTRQIGSSNTSTGNSSAWFASYVDVTATPLYSFQQMGDPSKSVNAVLSFIVSSKTEPCTPSWGSVYTMDKAESVLSLDTRIARLRQRDGSIAISFGGLLNNELAINCSDPNKLLSAYRDVVTRYKIDTIDLDLEKDTLTNTEASKRRVEAISKLQRERRDAGKSLAVWLTLPVTTQGLSEDGTTMVASFLKQKVDLAGVNAMTMNFGQTLVNNQTMAVGSQSALTNVHRQLGILYQQNGIFLNEQSLWSKIGTTPMIGQNDIQEEVFTLADALSLNGFARQHSLGRVSMWSANRDIACGSNYVNIKLVSDSCSGVNQETGAFDKALSEGFIGDISKNATHITTSNGATNLEKIVDDPATSPYQIWSKTGAYLQGTKVVWRKNVYQAKWWTQGDMPDNPVLQTWQTPWELIGPVLPGDKPIPQPTLPAGTYPEWKGTSTYNAGQRVLFNGVPYQAKWWTQGDSPAAVVANPNTSPWIPLTQDQIDDILNSLH